MSRSPVARKPRASSQSRIAGILAAARELLAEQGVNPPDGVVPAVALNPVQIQNLAQALYQASQAMAKVNPALGLQP